MDADIENVESVDLLEGLCNSLGMSFAVEKKSRTVTRIGSSVRKTVQDAVTRIPSGIRKTIQAAADLEGASLDSFIVRAAHRHAQEILDRETIIRLNREQTRRVFELLDKPTKPNGALLSAKAAHQKLVRA